MRLKGKERQDEKHDIWEEEATLAVSNIVLFYNTKSKKTRLESLLLKGKVCTKSATQ